MNQHRQAEQNEYDMIRDQALSRLHPDLCIWCSTDFGLKYRYASDLTTWQITTTSISPRSARMVSDPRGSGYHARYAANGNPSPPAY